MKRVNGIALSSADTGTGAHNGVQLDSGQWYSVSFHAIFGDASATGTLKVQASNDEITNTPNDFTVTSWVDIPNATASIASGAQALITVNPLSYRWLRVVYTGASGGSTTILVNFFAIAL